MLAMLHLLVMSGRHLQVATQARGREPISPSSAQYRFEASAPRLRLHGSDRVLLVWMMRIWPTSARRIPGCKAEDDIAMASLCLQSVLALEIPK
jgi:hypothetical protein